MRRTVLTTILLLLLQPVSACLILVLTDGRNVLIANHEDWPARDAEVIVEPAGAGRYGFIGFAFSSDHALQGGMNTAGLFFDGTATPFVPLDFGNKPAFPGAVWRALLERCPTVEAALTFLTQYRLPDLERAHILLADRSGASAVLGAYDGKPVIHRREGQPFQLLTNFNLVDPSYGNEPVCRRFQTAADLLARDSSATVANAVRILSKTHQQELTAYSNVYDLKAGEVWVYRRTDFQRGIGLNLARMLQKGKRRQSLESLFAAAGRK
ncbi:carcinine hydrolase/isopenicillin-N N-acyltransferase family protein [Larkinella soli]|uniref:carcinine hydrolase/isopenicillin-N N-acyltransferase family protein n=1 Tax=Larkinella soli TaxID=1770527 RepID=UPI000FFB96C5|nr:carcinine hydrolase/isopenicillin-N N-acyltransferase family protein [Larkinella soli]